MPAPGDAAALGTLSEQDHAIRASLLRAAWTMQALKDFIFSSIMDIRSCGIFSFCVELQTWSRDYANHRAHPVLQYATRYIKQKNLTSYIFGAESHASIINGSRDIVTFLASFGGYTNLETDVIWQACTTSVESVFSKASFAVLDGLLHLLDF